MSVSDKTYSNDNSTEVNLTKTEKERILRIINQTDKEKIESFIYMLRRNTKLKQAKITHK